MNAVYAGVDLGAKGGLAALQCVDGQVRQLECIKMPYDMKIVNVGKVQDFLIRNRVEFVALEQVILPNMQRGSIKSGENSGRLKAVLELCGITYISVRPSQWTKWAKVHTPGGTGITNAEKRKALKRRVIALCTKSGLHVPMTSTRFNATFHDGISDALLIGTYGIYAAHGETNRDVEIFMPSGYRLEVAWPKTKRENHEPERKRKKKPKTT